MPDYLKFLKEVEAKVVTPQRDGVRRNLDAIEELRSENSRLKRELEESREENRRLREQVAQNRSVPAVPVQTDNKSIEPEDDTKIRFSLLELK